MGESIQAQGRHWLLNKPQCSSLEHTHPSPAPCSYLYRRMGLGHYCCRSYSCSFGPSGCYLRRRRRPLAIKLPVSVSSNPGAQKPLLQIRTLRRSRTLGCTHPPSPEAWPLGSYPWPGASSPQAAWCGCQAHGPHLAAQGPGGWRRADCREPDAGEARMELSREQVFTISPQRALPSTDLVRGWRVR